MLLEVVQSELVIVCYIVLQVFTPQGCINTAADLLNKLDLTADPCDDFYQFACGSFIRETVIPDDRTRTSMFSILGDKLDVQVFVLVLVLVLVLMTIYLPLQVRSLLEEPIKPGDPKPFQMAKAVFHSCMDRETIEVNLIMVIIFLTS